MIFLVQCPIFLSSLEACHVSLNPTSLGQEPLLLAISPVASTYTAGLHHTQGPSGTAAGYQVGFLPFFLTLV